MTDLAARRDLAAELAAACRLPGFVLGERLHEGVLSEVHAAERAGASLVLKLYRFDLGRAVRLDEDPRLPAAARHLAIPPFFAPSAERIAALDPRGDVAVPAVLAEGRTASGVAFTLMTRLSGTRCPRRPAGRSARRRLGSEMGAVLARMHAPRAEAEVWSAVSWADEYEALLHALADHLPARVVGDERARWKLRLAVQRIVDRFRGIDPGPSVLAHGDFGPDNLLLDDAGRIAGVVDFQLSCIAPAAMDLRWIEAVDARAFLDAYGWHARRPREALWLGSFFQLLWEALILVALDRYSGLALPEDAWAPAARRFSRLLRRLRRPRSA